jgi:hypothetical protein
MGEAQLAIEQFWAGALRNGASQNARVCTFPVARTRSSTPVAVAHEPAVRLDPATYARHFLHADERVWIEKNCYIDVWIEAVHALECDPLAMLSFTVALDFEGDQWTFFKPKHEELFELYGIDVQELNVWRSLAEHLEVHLAAGKWIATEADAFYLPDTAGTDYQRKHTKTTIVVVDFNRVERRLDYFHNASLFSLSGDDFEALFHLGKPLPDAFMPLYAEAVRLNRVVRRPLDELRQKARTLLTRHVARRSARNPLIAFAEPFAHDIERLKVEGLEAYHAWAFATVRQLGAAMELLALHLVWFDDPALRAAALEFESVTHGAKTLILKGARAVNAKRPVDALSLLGPMAESWQRGIDLLEAALR